MMPPPSPAQIPKPASAPPQTTKIDQSPSMANTGIPPAPGTNPPTPAPGAMKAPSPSPSQILAAGGAAAAASALPLNPATNPAAAGLTFDGTTFGNDFMHSVVNSLDDTTELDLTMFGSRDGDLFEREFASWFGGPADLDEPIMK
jgi:hypothetical protein